MVYKFTDKDFEFDPPLSKTRFVSSFIKLFIRIYTWIKYVNKMPLKFIYLFIHFFPGNMLLTCPYGNHRIVYVTDRLSRLPNIICVASLFHIWFFFTMKPSLELDALSGTQFKFYGNVLWQNDSDCAAFHAIIYHYPSNFLGQIVDRRKLVAWLVYKRLPYFADTDLAQEFLLCKDLLTLAPCMSASAHNIEYGTYSAGRS